MIPIRFYLHIVAMKNNEYYTWYVNGVTFKYMNSRGSFSGSVSQRTFSFHSNADSIVNSAGLGVKVTGLELDDDYDLAYSRPPSLKRLIRMNASEWPYGLLGGLGAIVAGSLTPLFALIITQSL